VEYLDLQGGKQQKNCIINSIIICSS